MMHLSEPLDQTHYQHEARDSGAFQGHDQQQAFFRTKDFSEWKEIWIRKDCSDILLRVAFVTPIVLLGIVGNLTIIYSMFKFKPFRSKPTNIFILNMALADLLTTMVCPIVALLKDIYQFYVLGPFMCRFEGFVNITCLLVSSYSLIVLSSDWLLCVVKPCRKRISIEQSWLALAIIWLASVLMASPLFYWRQQREREWKDLVEVWCYEETQVTKYYWLVITFLLMYLPTLIMTIVLLVILAQMDQFEAKLRRSRAEQSHSSLCINIKYRRRIVKILFAYLLTSFICWTPLQFTILYRHFRTKAFPSPWFFELAFFSQLSASLTAVLNPIIFGFLSQPFRRIVTKMWSKMLSRRNKDNKAGIAKKNVAQSSLRPAIPPAPPEHRSEKLATSQTRFKNLQLMLVTTGSKHNARTVFRAANARQHWSPGSNEPGIPTANTATKRVSFNTSVRFEGQENTGFELPDNLTKLGRARTAAAHTSAFEASAAANSSLQAPLSLVSMDSINIEENLAGNDMGAAPEADPALAQSA